ncbi:MAG: hypothetical protein ACPKM0_02600 [Pleomorphochaeta sp.]
MNKRNNDKKRSVLKKVLISIGSILIIAIAAASIYWFSIPKGQRNMLTFMMFSGGNYDNYEVSQVIDRNEVDFEPTTYIPVAAETSETDHNQNIAVVTEMLQNESSSMLKGAYVQTIGVEDYTGWHFLADEGAAEGEYPYGPSPLSYYTTGVATNLHTQILYASDALAVELDDVKVEVVNKFRWNQMSSDNGTGHTDTTKTSVIIESSASEEAVQSVIDLAFNAWAAGEALANKTTIEPQLVINGENWNNYNLRAVTSLSDESVVDGFMISSVTDKTIYPETIELALNEEQGMSLSSMDNMEFEIYAISESANNSDRPQLKKATISTPSGESWEIYSDEFMSEDDTPLAPTSLEYFTAGTALCLTSQTTLVSAMMDLDFTEYRVENQTDYREENINSDKMVSYADTVHSYVLIESDESKERLEEFYNKSLSLCFAGEGLSQETEMITTFYLNNKELK